MNIEGDYIPGIKEGYIPSDLHPSAVEYPEYPDHMIRLVSPLDASREVVVRGRELHADLATTFHIAVVPYEAFDAGIDELDHQLMYFVEKVNGATLDYDQGIGIISPDQHGAAIELVDKLFSYHIAKSKTGEEYLNDIFNFSQYVFTPDNVPVLVDIEPRYALSVDPEDQQYGRYEEEFQSAVSLLEMAVSVLRHKDNPELRVRWQDRCSELIRTISVSNQIGLTNDTVRAVRIAFMNGELEEVVPLLRANVEDTKWKNTHAERRVLPSDMST